MATARDLIRRSLLLIGAISTGETPSADELVDALATLNDMVDSWSTEGLTIFNKTRETFPIVGGTASYTIGTGGTFNTSRPQRIEHAAIYDVTNAIPYESLLELITSDQWAQLPTKLVSSSLPTKLYNDDAYPLATLSLWPVPAVSKQIIITSWKPMANLSNANASVDLPPGYTKALRYNLAIELCAEYGKSASSEVIQGAMEGKENIKRMNCKPVYLSVDEAIMGGKKSFNYLVGE